nr:MAG TPA: hypothetical protein [Caudoviricetes sp.]
MRVFRKIFLFTLIHYSFCIVTVNNSKIVVQLWYEIVA